MRLTGGGAVGTKCISLNFKQLLEKGREICLGLGGPVFLLSFLGHTLGECKGRGIFQDRNPMKHFVLARGLQEVGPLRRGPREEEEGELFVRVTLVSLLGCVLGQVEDMFCGCILRKGRKNCHPS